MTALLKLPVKFSVRIRDFHDLSDTTTERQWLLRGPFSAKSPIKKFAWMVL